MLTCTSLFSRFSSNAHHHGSLPQRLVGGLRPAPESRSRGAFPHLLRSLFTVNQFMMNSSSVCFCSTLKPRKSNVSGLLSPFLGSVRRIFRTRSGAFCLDGVPNQTSSTVLGDLPENGLLLLGAGNLERYHRHIARRSRLLAHTSCARRLPRDRKRSAGRYWQASAKSPTLAVYPSSFPTTRLPPSPQRLTISGSAAGFGGRLRDARRT